MNKNNNASLFVTTYGKYTRGSLRGAWLKLNDFAVAEDFFNKCREVHKDEADPEFAFFDYQGIPSVLQQESMSVDEVQRILDFIHLPEEKREIVEDYWTVADYDPDMEFDVIIGRHIGKYDSLQAYTDEIADELIESYRSMCENEHDCRGAKEMIDTLATYFNYESFYNSNKYNYYYGDAGHVFYLY